MREKLFLFIEKSSSEAVEIIAVNITQAWERLLILVEDNQIINGDWRFDSFRIN